MANEDKRIIELPASESILNDDWIGKDSASQGTTKIQLSLLKQLFGGNNFAGEWHSGTAYNKDSYVTHEGKLYHNIKGGSVVAVDWSSSQWEQVSIGNELRKIVESLAPTFDTSTNYKVDDLVIYNNTLYRCIVAHTAGTWVGSHFGTVKVSSLLLSSIMDNFTDRYWENYSGSPVNYTKGTVIHKGLKLYRCKANTTNQSWDSSKWEQVDVTDLINSVTVLAETVLSNIAPTFSSLAQYSINDFVIYNNHLYVCMKPHHGSWDPLDFGTGKIGDILKGIFNNIADVYNPSNSYVKGDVVNYLGMPLKCIVDTATSPMVFSEWERVTFEQLIDEKVADVQIAGQTTTDENKISDLTSLAIEGTASGEIASFSDGSNLPMRSFICNIDAVQDLHGYDYPWVGGAGKNKLPNGLKTGNHYGISFTKQSNGTYILSGTSNLSSSFDVYFESENGSASTTLLLPSGTYKLSGISGGSQSTYRLYVAIYESTTRFVGLNDGETTFTLTEDTYVGVFIRIYSETIINNLTVYPMIRLATETDPTFAPYENICPISGHTGVDAWVRGKNLYNNEVGNLSVNGVTFTKNADGSITTSGTSTSNAYYNMSNVVFPKGTYIANGCPSGGADNKYKISVYNNSTSVTIGTGDTGEGTQFEVDGESEYRLFIRIANNQDMNGFTFYPMIRLATIEDATYEPYNSNSQTIQVSWQTEAGEVFGGYVDLVSGVLTVTHKSKTGFTRGRQDSSNKLYNIGAIWDMKSSSNVNVTDNYFEPLNLDDARASETPSITQYLRILYIGGYIGKEAELDTLLGTLQVKYELETPITYQLTPQQIKSLKDDITNAWASTGNVNVKFNKDATTVINSLIARIEALENA